MVAIASIAENNNTTNGKWHVIYGWLHVWTCVGASCFLASKHGRNEGRKRSRWQCWCWLEGSLPGFSLSHITVSHNSTWLTSCCLQQQNIVVGSFRTIASQLGTYHLTSYIPTYLSSELKYCCDQPSDIHCNYTVFDIRKKGNVLSCYPLLLSAVWCWQQRLLSIGQKKKQI